MLETLGFLSIEPGRGTFISSSNPTQSGALSNWRYSRRYEEDAVFQTRLALECAIVAEAAARLASPLSMACAAPPRECATPG